MWECKNCHEQVADQYAFCWNCGARNSHVPSVEATALPQGRPAEGGFNLPAWITRVGYKVAGSYGYRGDLIITREAIYYFPHTDLRKKWEQQPEVGGMFGMLGPVGSVFGSAVSGAAASLEGETISLFVQPYPTIDLKSVWGESVSLKKLQGILDAYFLSLKQHGSKGRSSSDLPTPKQYRKGEVKNLSLTLLGILSFDAQYDDHTFKVGVINKGKTQKALQESGFIP